MKPRIFRILKAFTAAVLFAALPLTSDAIEATQQPLPGSPDGIKVNGQRAPKTVSISYEAGQVLKLVRAKVNDDVVMAFIENSSSGFALTAEEIVQLHNEGISDKMIQAMLARKKQNAQPQAVVSVVQQAAPQEAAPQQPTVVQQPATVVAQPAVTYVQSQPVYVPAPTTYVYAAPYYSYYDPYPYWGYSAWSPRVSLNFGWGGHYGGHWGHWSGHHVGFRGGSHGGFHGGHRR
jgi:hypothetical protein